jgi:quercetin dioxygenase-like cupin family protein
MAIPHARPGEVIDVQPLGATLREQQTRALVKGDGLEVLRLVLTRDKEIPIHSAPGPITVQCLEGRVAFTALRGTVELQAGQMLFLSPGEPHSLLAYEDSSLLVTLALPWPREGARPPAP